MSVASGVACQIKDGLFSGCKDGAVGYCQYCARLFCARHTLVLEPEQQVCSRKNCAAKWEDLQAHLAYKDVVFARNAEEACGIEGCDRATYGQCVRCKGYFCPQHVGPREEVVLENKVRMKHMATLCLHCSERREIWLRA